MEAKYWIAQTVPDIFRNEPKNIGVFVSYGGEVTAKFFGESDMQIDGRRLKSMPYPDVYKQWVSYWRKQITKNPNMESIITRDGNYRVSLGGELSHVEQDTAADLANYLYSMLVSEGGFKEAIGGEEPDEDAAVALVKDLAKAFSDRNIFGSPDKNIKHPVQTGVVVTGKNNVAHRPAFVQENGHLCVMESVDFTIAHKARSKDHAGLAAYMFSNLRASRPTVEPISIVKYTEAEMENVDVKYALSLLNNESNVVNWHSQEQRAAFLSSRVDTAFN